VTLLSSEPPHRLGIVAGMPRAGTTYLYHAFASHPGAFVPYRKELRYFGQQFNNGPSWYKGFFQGATNEQVCIDCSPDYFLVPEVPQRIRDMAPRARVILGIRDPATWALSLYQQILNIGEFAGSLDQFLNEMTYPSFGASTSFPAVHLRKQFIRTQIDSFRTTLGDRLLLFDFDVLGRAPLETVCKIERFLELPAHFAESNLPKGRINAGNRRKSSWFSYLMSRDPVIRMAGATLPRPILVKLRLTIDRLNSKTSAAEVRIDSPEFRQCAEALAGDRHYVRATFRESAVIDGTGRAIA
jgi:Sulfotransferase domain